MSEGLDAAIRDKLTKVCLCKGISRKVIKEAIGKGADTFEEVQRVTGAGSGGCKGNRCRPKIEELIEDLAKEE